VSNCFCNCHNISCSNCKGGVVTNSRRRSGKNLVLMLLVPALMLIAVAAYWRLGSPVGTSQASSPSATHPQTPQLSTSTANDPIMLQVKQMNLDEKIGQMVMAGVDGYQINEHARSLIKEYQVGGFILFGQNISSTKQTLDLVNSLKAANADSKAPLLLGIDNEGGRVSRMPNEYVKIPTSKLIGQANSSDLSYDIGQLLGQEVNALGLNLDFAPVLDINSNPNNQVIGDRSFGSDPQLVGKLGLATMQGIESQNVISVVKHFPGHGDTSVDSHIGLPIVYNGRDRLESFELVPFQQAISNHAEMVMVAHILLPKIDSRYPASLSPTLISDWLKGRLGFQGVVITDDLTMGAIVKHYDIGKAAVQSVKAGSDIVLVCHDYDKEVAVINALRQAARNGTIPAATIDNSVYKILQLKQKHHLQDQPTAAPDIQALNNATQAVLQQYLTQ
jgi:beta-N-acetylhexosaminidase